MIRTNQVSNIKGKDLRSSLCIVVWATAYHIWSKRNSRIHGEEIKTEESVVKSVRKDVKFRMMFKGSASNFILSRVLCCNWFVPHSIFCLKVC